MHVTISELVPGCILSKDVYVKANKPLIKRKTVLTPEHIHVLSIFLVESVHTEPKLVNGASYRPKAVLEESKEERKSPSSLSDQDSFLSRYLRAVHLYKKQFAHWQGGTKLDPYAMREIFLPLYEKEVTKEQLMELHHYSDKDNYISYHAVAVGILSSLVGKKIGLSNAEVIQLGLAGLLADCGMARISFNVFNKASALTKSEYEEVKKHPVVSYRMLEEVPGFSKKAMLGVLQHHEREDGSGYPLSIKSNKLHQYGKIIAVVDAYHAMTVERRYRSKQTPYKVIESLLVDEFGKLDHTIVKEFVSMMLPIAIGQRVRLTNGSKGEIIYLNKELPTRPLIRLDSGEQFDLAGSMNIYIEEVFSNEEQQQAKA
ncbi:HD-GYP domain-containing protein [Paenalkalicoccus suaedae]|uniref:HD-GYP domain-containing protein n=1 Tax=Paenalkalicoccus suaedae TaxID=2592382 RepID=A0A859FAH7_9BACI|nr:HD-GYP domain-containing protein [Paenalkalicoccus suaedae]QKS69601.1 HD-GYP domain-containing protein [Paenalkalicoccus suaedae]